jgi:bud site selection protein 20
MGRYSVKRYKTKRRTRDLDLIYDDLQSKESIVQLKNQELDETKPGMAQFYCIHCAKHFEDDHAIKSHYKSKVHKRRLKELKFKPYTPLESEAASGINLQKFLNSVERAKERQKQEEEHKEELKELVETNNPKGIMNPENQVLEENEVIME